MTCDKVGGFLRVFRFPPPNKTDRHDITEILLKVALNTINQKTTSKNLPKRYLPLCLGCLFRWESCSVGLWHGLYGLHPRDLPQLRTNRDWVKLIYFIWKCRMIVQIFWIISLIKDGSINILYNILLIITGDSKYL